jgi:hypothetical protein
MTTLTGPRADRGAKMPLAEHLRELRSRLLKDPAG